MHRKIDYFSHPYYFLTLDSQQNAASPMWENNSKRLIPSSQIPNSDRKYCYLNLLGILKEFSDWFDDCNMTHTGWCDAVIHSSPSAHFPPSDLGFWLGTWPSTPSPSCHYVTCNPIAVPARSGVGLSSTFCGGGSRQPAPLLPWSRGDWLVVYHTSKGVAFGS